MPFELTILGCSSALPTSTRHPSAQLVNLLGRFFLIDCGEGTQAQLRKYHIKIQKINYICISHLHGDHYLGLIGLLSTMSLLHRKKELTIFAPKGLSAILDLHFKLSYSQLSYPIKMVNLEGGGLNKIFEDNAIELYSFNLKHRIPCWGFKLIEKKKPRKILRNMIDKYNIPFSNIQAIKDGQHYITEKGEKILNKKLTLDSHLPRSYAYCSDTKYFTKLSEYVSGVDILYHESTFHSDLNEKAIVTFHSTAQNAAEVARDSKVKKLIIGHFSSRYKNLDILKKDAEKIFKNVDLAEEGKVWQINKKYSYENNY